MYTKEDGTQPVKDFMHSIDIKLRAKIYHGIKLLKDNGNTLREPYTKFIDDGIFELRGKQGSDIAREIALAKKYRENYMNEHPKEHFKEGK